MHFQPHTGLVAEHSLPSTFSVGSKTTELPSYTSPWDCDCVFRSVCLTFPCCNCCLLCVLQEILGNCNLQPTTAAGPGIPESRRGQVPVRIGFGGFGDIQARIDEIFGRIGSTNSGRKLRDVDSSSSHRMK